MNAECRTITPADLARSADDASIFRPWRRSDALRIGVLAAAVALAGCAGMAGTTSPVSGSAPATAPQTAVTQNPAAPFSAGVTLIGSSPLRLGDPVSFILTTSTAGYGHLYMLNASGTVVALAENLPVAPDTHTLFPPPGARFAIHARPPVGTDRVLFLVTQQPFPGVRRRRRGAGAGDAYRAGGCVHREPERGHRPASGERLGPGGDPCGGRGRGGLRSAGRSSTQPGDGQRAHNVLIPSSHVSHRGRSAWRRPRDAAGAPPHAVLGPSLHGAERYETFESWEIPRRRHRTCYPL